MELEGTLCQSGGMNDVAWSGATQMADYLRFAGQPHEVQRAELVLIIREQPLLMEILTGLRAEALPDAWLVSGAIYNTVWNVLTGRPSLTGINDFDIAYFDGRDLSYEAED
ncbi:nucleotidyltransferase family protein, partial [Mesorhizobium humile]